MPLSSRDEETSSSLGNCSFKSKVNLNRWATVTPRVLSSGKCKVSLKLLGNVQTKGSSPAKSVRTYSLSDSGALPQTFWTVVVAHYEHNFNQRLEEARKANIVKSAWPVVESYVAETPLIFGVSSWDDRHKNDIKNGEPGSLTIKTPDGAIDCCLTVRRNGTVNVDRLDIRSRHLTPDQIKAILDIASEPTTKQSKPAILSKLPIPGEFFSDDY